jgi:hypothetical protein
LKGVPDEVGADEAGAAGDQKRHERNNLQRVNLQSEASSHALCKLILCQL